MNYFVRLDVFGPKPNVLWLGPGGAWVHDLGGALAFTSRKKAERAADLPIRRFVVHTEKTNKVEASIVRISTPHRVAVDLGVDKVTTGQFRPFANVIAEARKA